LGFPFKWQYINVSTFNFYFMLCVSSDDNDEKDDDDDDDDDDDRLSAMEESSLSESEDDEIISSIRPSKKVIYSSESEMSGKQSDGSYLYLLISEIVYRHR